MKKLFFFISTLSALSIGVNAQNTSPYWSLVGNSNATSSSKLGTTNAINLRIFTNNAERIRVTTSGLVGINTTAPNSRLHINSTTGQNPLRCQVNGATKFFVDDLGGTSIGGTSTPPANGLYVSGNVGIGTAAPSYKLHVVTTGTAIYGNSTGGAYGVYGASTYTGVYGSGTSYGVIGSGNYGVYGGGSSYGLYGSGGTYGVYGNGTSYGVYGNSSGGYGIRGVSSNNIGVYGSSSSYLGVYGSGGTYGVYGTSTNGKGVYGISSSAEGVYGYSTNKQGGWFQSQNSQGVWAKTVAGDYAGVFEGNVYTYGTYNSSDKSLKKDIKEFTNAMDIINKLKPKKYDFRSDGKYASLNLPKGDHYGLIAQEIEEVLPNLVKENAHDIYDKVPGAESVLTEDVKPGTHQEQNFGKQTIKIKAVNYTELIPIIVKGMQELNADKDKKIADLQNEINELKAMVQNLSKLVSNNTTNLSSTAFLKQNAPNPFNDNTIITYYIPGNAGYAQIKVTDVKGSVIKSFNAAKGDGQINIRAGELPAGTYNYTLYINNKTVDTKQMVLLK